MKKFRPMTKKEVKSFKKEIIEYTAITNGWWIEIFSEIALINHRLMFEIIKQANELGIIYNDKHSDYENFIVTEFVKEIGYQDFKKLIPYFLGFPNAYLEGRTVYI
ncbi:hypothetical protein O3794_02775 [Gemella sanguinis]|uniref:hypothetical protein n=1 Tax=Gemella sanguinis TaxID=84135 RepID=UPI00352EFACD